MSKIFVVGMGPGNIEDMTERARTALEDSDLIIGYSTYIDLIREYFPGKTLISSGMTQEVDRCRMVVEKAAEGNIVSLVSSGDSGIYGMAGIMLEVVNNSENQIPVEVIPGVTAASAAAAVLGAPVMHDFAVISLSDRLTPWELIEKRLECAGDGDFVVCLYNPKSKGRSDYIDIARNILMKYRGPDTPVGIVRNAGRKGTESVITTLAGMLDCEIDMFTMVIVGNSRTYTQNGRMITPRGYSI